MKELERCFCPNEQCKDHGLRRQGNIAVRGKYGKDKSRDLLYCRTCGKRFASTQASALFGLHLSAETIRQIIHYAAEGGWRASYSAPAGAGQGHGQPGDPACRRALCQCALRPAGLSSTMSINWGHHHICCIVVITNTNVKRERNDKNGFPSLRSRTAL